MNEHENRFSILTLMGDGLLLICALTGLSGSFLSLYASEALGSASGLRTPLDLCAARSDSFLSLAVVLALAALVVWSLPRFRWAVAAVLAAVLGRVDFTPVAQADWIGFPIHWDATVFSIFKGGDVSLMITAVITIMPLALATIVEHIGDISAISSTVDRNYIEDPGLHRTLLGDGAATILASLFGAPANTTYGENTGVLSLTKVFDPMVIRLAAGFAILFSFSPKVATLIGCMPTATVGGVSLVLYGMISAVGVRNVVESRVDFSQSRNIIIAALILVLSIGIKYSAAGVIAFQMGELTISLSGLAVGALAGIILNAILPDQNARKQRK